MAKMWTAEAMLDLLEYMKTGDRTIQEVADYKATAERLCTKDIVSRVNTMAVSPEELEKTRVARTMKEVPTALAEDLDTRIKGACLDWLGTATVLNPDADHVTLIRETLFKLAREVEEVIKDAREQVNQAYADLDRFCDGPVEAFSVDPSGRVS